VQQFQQQQQSQQLEARQVKPLSNANTTAITTATQSNDPFGPTKNSNSAIANPNIVTPTSPSVAKREESGSEQQTTKSMPNRMSDSIAQDTSKSQQLPTVQQKPFPPNANTPPLTLSPHSQPLANSSSSSGLKPLPNLKTSSSSSDPNANSGGSKPSPSLFTSEPSTSKPLPARRISGAETGGSSKPQPVTPPKDNFSPVNSPKVPVKALSCAKPLPSAGSSDAVSGGPKRARSLSATQQPFGSSDGSAKPLPLPAPTDLPPSLDLVLPPPDQKPLPLPGAREREGRDVEFILFMVLFDCSFIIPFYFWVPSIN
jgi:hypothetical protein